MATDRDKPAATGPPEAVPLTKANTQLSASSPERQADTSTLFQTACLEAPALLRASLVGHFKSWIHAPHTQLAGPDEIVWFISKRAHVLINEWLMNKRLSVLTPVSPANTGGIVITKERIEHVLNSRTKKDKVSKDGVLELLGQIFAHGNPKYAPNPGYDNQLLMFDATYKAIDPAARGESPVAAIQFEGYPRAQFRLETAYWMKPAKTKALEKGALIKKNK